MKCSAKWPACIAFVAFMPVAAQAVMQPLTDGELRAVEGRASLGPGFQIYKQNMGELWTDMTTSQGKSAVLHYAGHGSVMTGYTLIAASNAAAVAINKAPPPINRLDGAVVPLWLSGYGIGTAGLMMLSVNGE
jgi:hypothetical protein